MRLVVMLLFICSSALADNAKIPVLVTHGIYLKGEAYGNNSELRKFFASKGFELLAPETPLSGSIERRGEILYSEIQRLVPTGRFHIIGHSMGGLDGRYVIHRYGLGDRVISLTTLATPHRGTPVADLAISIIDKNPGDNPIFNLLIEIFGEDIAATRHLTSRYLNEEFNPNVPDDPRVAYFSMGFAAHEKIALHSIVPYLWWGHRTILDAGKGANDGMVPVESARWGTYLGTLELDHAAESLPVPYSGKVRYLDVFNQVLDNLHKRYLLPF